MNILCLMLHGDKSPDGAIKSFRAFDEYRAAHLPGVPHMQYADSYGFPVFCVVLFVSPHYTADGTFISAWEKICGKYGIDCASSDERVLDFKGIMHDRYTLPDSRDF